MCLLSSDHDSPVDSDAEMGRMRDRRVETSRKCVRQHHDMAKGTETATATVTGKRKRQGERYDDRNG